MDFHCIEALLGLPEFRVLAQSLFEKYQAASRLSIKRVIATDTNVSLVVGNASSSLRKRRQWFTQANVLSTTHRCGTTAKPFWPAARATDSRTRGDCSLPQAVHAAPRYVPATHTLRRFLQGPRICWKLCRAPAWSDRAAAVTMPLRNPPRVSTHPGRLRPLPFLPWSSPLSAPPPSVVFTDCLSSHPAVGWVCRASFSLRRARHVSWMLTHPPGSVQARKA